MSNPTPVATAELVTINHPLARYAAALLQIATTLVGAFVLLPDDTFAGGFRLWAPASLGLLIVALGAVGTYWVPLLGARESAILKVSVAIAAGVAGALVDFIAAGIVTPTSIGFLVLAILNGLSTQIGANIRKESGEGGRHAA